MPYVGTVGDRLDGAGLEATMLRTLSALLLSCLMAAATTTAAAQDTLRLEPVALGLEQPVFVAHVGDGSERLFVVEQAGRILIVDQGELLAEPFLDLREDVSSGGERGLLGLAFHPEFADNRRYFVHYTRAEDGASVISEFRASRDPSRSRPAGRALLTVGQPFANHNGGMIAFGPDGFLYIALGDGGSGGDPGNRAQNPNVLLGKILRIDVDGRRPYAIPPDNPFIAGGGRPEVYALGLRNPWRFSFDRKKGRLFAGDVGQGQREEIDVIRRGRNYGWRVLEGSRCFDPPEDCEQSGFKPPRTEYGHGRGRCSVTGGYFYRGREVPALKGTYVFGDYCSGEIFGLRKRERSVLLDTDLSISSFGEDAAGELYVVDHGGAIYRIEAAP
ncbi:MAG: PQQ-dependent sugar dehydrogenase [Geminicoccaceae bacterium]